MDLYCFVFTSTFISLSLLYSIVQYLNLRYSDKETRVDILTFPSFILSHSLAPLPLHIECLSCRQ